LANKVVTTRTFKQLGPVDVTSIIPGYTVDYEEDGIPLENSLDVTPIPIISTDNIDDYRYLLDTTHTDDEDIIVGYRQNVLHNDKFHSDTDNDIPYRIHDLVR
jgi:hypothetical protein